MKTILLRLFLLCCCLGIALNTIAIKHQYLHENWTFGQARFPNRNTATVPGVVHLDLLNAKQIDDPYWEMNERSVQWIDKEDWVYELTFIPDKEIAASGNITINFDGLDTYADIYLNDVKILKANNMFRRWSVDIKPYLLAGENRLKVYFHSPIKIDMPKWEQTPYQYNASNDQSENGGVFDRKLSVFARKAGYHYGWDWGPRLVTSGIWRSVYLTGWDCARINDVHFRQHCISKSEAKLTGVVSIESDAMTSDANIIIKDKRSGKTLASRKCDLIKGQNQVMMDFTIKNPRLWWCNGLGTPELYTFSTSVTSDGVEVDSKDERIGLRSIQIVTSNDQEGKMQFYFIINGVPVFAKGTNYIPQDNFLPRITRQQYLTTLRDAAEANMNMIRVWGGGIYEDDIFYDICDELGLMVWQDFMFACSSYPASGEWLENVEQEAIDNVCRLRNHPSIVLWCGGNECLDAWYNWGWKNKLEKNSLQDAQRIENEMNRLFFETLPNVVKQYAPESFYWPSSPFSGKGHGSDGVNGDRHYWSVWHRKAPIDSYNQDCSHFFSEYGMQSFPEMSTIRKFAPDVADHSIDSEVLMAHQRGGVHANRLIQWYLSNEYGDYNDFEEFLYANQVLQGDAMRTAIEAHRRKRPYCMGSLLWQHNDCWPVASWSTRDYYGNWKAAHYMVRKAFENVITSASVKADSIRVYVISDVLRKQKGQLTVKLFLLNGQVLDTIAKEVDIPANTSTVVWAGKLSDYLHHSEAEDVVINIAISTDGYAHDGNFYLCKQKALRLLPPQIHYEIKSVDDGYELTLHADNFIRALQLSVDGEQNRFDDNFFDLIPGITKTCRIQSALPLNEFKTRLKMKSLNEQKNYHR